MSANSTGTTRSAATEPGISGTTYRHVEHCMGTVFSFDVRGLSRQRAGAGVASAVSWLHEVDARFSPYRPESEVTAVAEDRLDLADASALLREVVRQAEAIGSCSDGFFTLYPSGRFDPSGFVKGWAVQRASDLLTEYGSTSHCVNGGGDVQAVGMAGPDLPWRIGIAHPADPQRLAAVVQGPAPDGDAFAVATSGTAERGAHIEDPVTGAQPVELASVTLVGRSLADVDALATAAFAMGECARRWLEHLSGVEAFAVRPDGTTWSTSGFGSCRAR